MTKRVNNPQDLGNLIREGKPTEILYDLGNGEERTELLVTSWYEGEDSRISHRIKSSPLVKLSKENGETLMDITDSDLDADSYSYEGLRPRKVVYGQPNHSQELGDLEIYLEGGKRLGISQFYRQA